MSKSSSSKLVAGTSKAIETRMETEGRRKVTMKASAPPKEVPLESPSEEETESLRVVANRLYQEAKTHLEQSGNIKTIIKETVIENLGRMYEIILKLNEDRQMLRAKTTQLKSKVEGGINKELIEQVREQNGLIKETLEEVKNMKVEMEKIGGNLESGTLRTGATYAEKAARNSIPMATSGPATSPIHSIVVSSDNAKDSSEDVINKIRTAVEAKTTGIRVDRVRKAKDQKVVIGCASKEELEKIKDKISTGQPGLKVESKQNKDPLVIMRNILSYNTDEDILASLKAQNANVIGHIKGEDYRACVRYRRRARNQLESHVVLQVSPKVWQALTEAGRVHIDLQRVVVQDQTPLIQCSRCLGYGHGKKLCTETENRCSHCGGPHLRVECPIRLSGGGPTCHNCAAAKIDKTEHNSYNESCPVRGRWDRLARLTVAYC